MAFSVSANRDIERWVANGLIDRATAEKLYADLANSPGRFGLGAVLGVLGAVLLGAAFLSLIAANWEAIPRLVRVAVILALIAFGYIGGAWRMGRGDAVFSVVHYLLAAVAFGGGIALIGQMYHLSGDAASAALVWCVGTLLAAFLLLSGNLAAMAGLVGLFYLFGVAAENSWHSTHYYWVVPPLALGVAAIARLTHTRLGLHSSAWLVLGLFLFIRIEHDAEYLDYAFAVGGAIGFFAFVYFEDMTETATHFARALQFYALAAAFAGLAALQLQLLSGNTGGTILLGIAIIGLAIAALAFRGRDHGQVRTISYIAFSLEVLYLAYQTVGSILGTSLFFFLIGIFVIFLAFLVVRLERRFKSPEAGGIA
jgi:uncharacterized membrane protein